MELPPFSLEPRSNTLAQILNKSRPSTPPPPPTPTNDTSHTPNSNHAPSPAPTEANTPKSSTNNLSTIADSTHVSTPSLPESTLSTRNPPEPEAGWLEYYKWAQPEFWKKKIFILREDHRNLILHHMKTEKWDVMGNGLRPNIEKFLKDVAFSPEPNQDDIEGLEAWLRLLKAIRNRVKNSQQELVNQGFIVKETISGGHEEEDEEINPSKKRKRGRYSWRWSETNEDSKAWLRQTLQGLNWNTEDKWTGFLDTAVEVFGPGFANFASRHLQNGSPNFNVSGLSIHESGNQRSNTTKHHERDDQRMESTETESPNDSNRHPTGTITELQRQSLDARGPLASKVSIPDPQSPGRFPTTAPLQLSINPYATPQQSPLAYDAGRPSNKRAPWDSLAVDASTQTINQDMTNDKRTELCECIQTKSIYKLTYRTVFQRSDSALNASTSEEYIRIYNFQELDNANLRFWKEWHKLGLGNTGVLGRGHLGQLIGNYIESGYWGVKTHKLEITVEKVKLMRRMGQKYSQHVEILTPIKFEDQEAIRVELP